MPRMSERPRRKPDPRTRAPRARNRSSENWDSVYKKLFEELAGLCAAGSRGGGTKAADALREIGLLIQNAQRLRKLQEALPQTDDQPDHAPDYRALLAGFEERIANLERIASEGAGAEDGAA
jgi:hypothetical protein